MNIGHVSAPIEVRKAAIQLRDYQTQALAKIKQLYARGVRRQVLSLPTGLGKTVIFTRLHKELNFHKRVLVIAHRHELIQQAVAHYGKLGHRFSKERIDPWYQNVSVDGKIWITTVQSLTHRKNKRIERFKPEDFQLVICDEAHHSVAGSYISVCDHLGITEKRFQGLFFGVTATPMRYDGKCLGKLFDEAVCVIDTFKAIEDGWLVGIKYLQAHSLILLDDLRTEEDFNLQALGKRIDQDSRNSLIFKAWKQQAFEKRAIAFCATVEHAANVAATFRKHGVPAEAIHGRLSLEERSRILKEHRAGKITVLANCEILTEGYDDPDIECIIMARPTLSQPLYVQMIGRGLRLPSGIANLNKARESGPFDPKRKTHCVIIDVVDNCSRHDLEVVTALSLFEDSTEESGTPSAGDAQGTLVAPPNGHAPTEGVFNAVKPYIHEIDLFARRKELIKKGKHSAGPPQPVTEGPLAKWKTIAWGEQYKRALHRKIVARWDLRSENPSISFKRSKDVEYEVEISPSGRGRWTLSCKSSNGKRHSRTFQNVFEAFGCGEDFVFSERQEIDQGPIAPRSSAVLPIQKCLLRICNANAHEARTFAEAQGWIVEHMK
jgi:superfamily II DNA or RNA helicase